MALHHHFSWVHVMSLSLINLGTSPTGEGGDTNRAAFTKVNNAITSLDTLTIESKSAAFTVAASDNRKVLECNGTFTVTLPSGLAVGTSVTIVNSGSGTVTIAAGSGATLASAGSDYQIATQWGIATAYVAASSAWRAFGDLSSPA
jgi:hypothetical protein